MSRSNSPPLFIGILGAFIALSVSRAMNSVLPFDLFFVVGLIGIVCAVIVSVYFSVRFGVSRVYSWQAEKEWYNRIDSRVVSAYYRTRGRVLSRLGLIGR